MGWMPQPKDKDWLNGYKNKTPTYVVYKRPTSKRDTYRLKVKGWKKIFHANRDQKKAGVAILISDKIDFKTKAVVYSCHLFLIFSASVRFLPFLPFIEPIFAWNVPLVSLIFLKRSLVFPILLFASISLHWSLRKAFLSLLAMLWNSALT